MAALPEDPQHVIAVAHRFQIQQQGREAVDPQRHSGERHVGPRNSLLTDLAIEEGLDPLGRLQTTQNGELVPAKAARGINQPRNRARLAARRAFRRALAFCCFS